MYIQRIQIENVRGFGPAQVDLSLDRGDGTYAGWTVFAGRNASGKTTLLRAIALALVGPRGADRLQNTFRGWINAHAQRATVRVGLVPDAQDVVNGEEERPAAIEASLVWTATGGTNPRSPPERPRRPSVGPGRRAPRGGFSRDTAPSVGCRGRPPRPSR